MNSKLVFLALAGLATLTSGCAYGVDDNLPTPAPTTEADDELGAAYRSYVTLTADNRKCMAPMCGGYWVKDVNRSTQARYVSALDFTQSGLDELAIAKVQQAPAEELVMRGKLGPKDPQYGTRTFLVFEAWRGMPGVATLPGDVFYSSKDRKPAINCFAAPCPNEEALELNTSHKTYFDTFSVKRALKLFVDEAWLTDRIDQHGAIVAGALLDGQKLAAGYEQVLDATQVFLRIDSLTGPCAAFKLAACPDGQTWAYTRDADLCVVPNKCVADGNCPSLSWPACEPGYSVNAWRVDSMKCTQFACDPTFVME